MGRLPLGPNQAPARASSSARERSSAAPRQQVCSAATAPNGCGRSPFPSSLHHRRRGAPAAQTTPAMATATVQTVAQAMATTTSRTRHIHAHKTEACEYTARSRSAHSSARTAPANLAAACNLSCAPARLSPPVTTARGASHRARHDAPTGPRRHATTTLDSWRRSGSRPPPSAVAAPAQAARPAAVATRPAPRRAAPHRPHSPRAARPRTHTASTTQRHAPLHSVRCARTQPRQPSDEATCRNSLALAPTSQTACLMRRTSPKLVGTKRARQPV